MMWYDKNNDVGRGKRGMSMSKFLLIDGNSLIYRAFFALPPLTNSTGMHTNALYGFTMMLIRLLQEHQPAHVMVAFDAGKITFRNEQYPQYKSGRKKTPPELIEQFSYVKELLSSWNIAQFEREGYEADDIIGTFAKKASEQNMNVLVVTGDRDMFQLASPNVEIALTRKGVTEIERYDVQKIQDVYGLTPSQMIDLKGLMGDTSDQIPGIPGVGEKTALKWLHQYGSLEQLLLHQHELKGKIKEKVKQYEQQACLSKRLATICTDVPMDVSFDQIMFTGVDSEQSTRILNRFEFTSLREKIKVLCDKEESITVQHTDNVDYHIVSITEETIQTLEKQYDNIEVIDLEVYGENPHYATVVSLFLASQETYYYISSKVLYSSCAQSLRDWLKDPLQPKRGYDLHRTHLALHWTGIEFAGASFDVQLAAYLLDPTQIDQTIGGICAKYGLPYDITDEQVAGKAAKHRLADEPTLMRYFVQKVSAIRAIIPLQQKELQRDEMNDLFYKLELPLSLVLVNMEKKGIKIDEKSLKQLGSQFQQQIHTLVDHIHTLAGMSFNLNSPKQLGEVLFDHLGLPVIKKTKTGYSTDVEVLEKLESHHPILSSILQYRQLAKLQSTYVEGLMKEMSTDTKKVHTYYRQAVTATGRLSSQFPNLQNIPIRGEEGRKIRKVFIPERAGSFILAADYSQIELRILAHISKDVRLQEAFHQDLDIHAKTAADVFEVKLDEVDTEMRRSAKAVNFGIIYGMSDYGLAQNLNITRKEAGDFIEQYFQVFHGVRRYMEEIIKEAKQNGYVKTLLERRRYLPNINASHFNARSFAERTAMNTPIQGTAADIIKLAMVRMDEQLRDRRLKSTMLLQVHDELVFEVPEDELETMKALVSFVMEQAFPLSVPLKVEVNYGMNWYETK